MLTAGAHLYLATITACLFYRYGIFVSDAVQSTSICAY